MLHSFVLRYHNEGHRGKDALKMLFRNVNLNHPSLDIVIDQIVDKCISCKLGKAKYRNAPDSQIVKGTGPWEYISVDIAYVHVGNEARPFVCLVDNFTGMSLVGRLSRRETSDIVEIFRVWFSIFGAPKCILSDNAPEFKKAWEILQEDYPLLQVQFSPIYRHRSNGIVERKIRTLKEALRTCMIQMGTVNFTKIFNKLDKINFLFNLMLS